MDPGGAQAGKGPLELGRQLGRHPDQLAPTRRGELEPPGVEEEPLETVWSAPRGARAVDGIARDGVADRLEMDPDLVGPTGDQVHLEQGPAGKSLADPIARRRRATVVDHRHPRPKLRVPPDRRL